VTDIYAEFTNTRRGTLTMVLVLPARVCDLMGAPNFYIRVTRGVARQYDYGTAASTDPLSSTR
jgi:hypothetical protein